MRVTVFAVHGDGIHTHKSARFCRRHTNRVVNPPAAVKAVVAQRGASVAIPHKYYRRRKKWRYPRKSALEKPASIAAGIPPAALLVGQKPEPTYGEPPLPIVPPHSSYGLEVRLSAR